MSSTYTGTPSNITSTVAISTTDPSDGDAGNVASVNTALQRLTDLAEYLAQQEALAAVLFLISHTLPISASVSCVSANNLFIIISDGTSLYTGQPRGGWTSRSISIGTGSIRAIAQNGTIHVAVGSLNGSNPVLIKSTDGITWTNVSNSFTSQLNHVVWSSSANLFVAVGNNGLIITSPDGTTWTSRTSGTGSNILGLVYGNGLLVADISGSTTYLTSTDGITWTSRTLPSTPNGSFLVYACYSAPLGLFFYGASNGNLYSSPDGITWTSRQTGLGGGAIPFAVGRMVVVDTTIVFLTSFDGITWKIRIPSSQGSPAPSTAPLVMPNGGILFLTTSTTAFLSAPLPLP